MKIPSGKKIREMIPFHQLHAAMPLFSPAPRAVGSGAPMWLVRHAPMRWRTKPRYQVHVGLDVLSEESTSWRFDLRPRIALSIITVRYIPGILWIFDTIMTYIDFIQLWLLWHYYDIYQFRYLSLNHKLWHLQALHRTAAAATATAAAAAVPAVWPARRRTKVAGGPALLEALQRDGFVRVELSGHEEQILEKAAQREWGDLFWIVWIGWVDGYGLAGWR